MARKILSEKFIICCYEADQHLKGKSLQKKYILAPDLLLNQGFLGIAAVINSFPSSANMQLISRVDF